MDFRQFSRNANAHDVPGNLLELHFNILLFSDPGEKVLITVGSSCSRIIMECDLSDEQIDFAFLLLDTGFVAEDINLLAEATGKGGQMHQNSWLSP